MAVIINGDAEKVSSNNRNGFAVYEVGPGFIFCDGYTEDDVVVEWRFGKKRKVLYIKASEEVSTTVRRMDEAEHKRYQRENKCRIGGKRCDSTHCEICPFYLSETKGGAPLSLDELYEKNEFEIEDEPGFASPEKELLSSELWSAFFRFLNSLTSEERTLAEGIVSKTSDRALMQELGIAHQSTLSSKKMNVKLKMQKAMACFL